MLISVWRASRPMMASEVGIARPATTRGMPAATSEAKTRIRTRAAIGSDTVSARTRSSSESAAESFWTGPKPVSATS